MAEPFLALITPLTGAPPVIGGGPIVPPPTPGVPTHPIVIPPNAIGPGVPTHPIYIPVEPAHPIVIPPGAIGPGQPSHPIYLPPLVPSHPIVIPPGSIGPGLPTHPIVIPPPPTGPVDPGYGYPQYPVDPGYGHPEGGPPHPEHPIVLPPDLPEHLPDPDNRPIEWSTAWTEKSGWVVIGVPQGEHPTPS